MTDAAVSPPPAEKRENLLINITINIILPTLILSKLNESLYFTAMLAQLDSVFGSGMAASYQAHGTTWALVMALSFPIIYGLKDFVSAHKVNYFSLLGVIGVGLTGGISLLQLDPKYIAIKEAAIPGLLGLATIVSLRTRFPLVKTFLYNDKILQVERIAAALKQQNTERAFERTLVNATYLIACSFFLSSALNYGLAKYLLTSPPGTVEFNEQLGKMTALSFPVIALPATIVMMCAFFYLFNNIRKLTQLKLDDIVVEK